MGCHIGPTNATHSDTEIYRSGVLIAEPVPGEGLGGDASSLLRNQDGFSPGFPFFRGPTQKIRKPSSHWCSYTFGASGENLDFSPLRAAA